MQTGTLANWDIDKTRLPEAFDLGVAWLLAHLDAAPGRYEVDGGRVYVAIEEPGTKSPAQRRFESHARYADLQVLLQGAERQDYCTHYPDGAPGGGGPPGQRPGPRQENQHADRNACQLGHRQDPPSRGL